MSLGLGGPWHFIFGMVLRDHKSLSIRTNQIKSNTNDSIGEQTDGEEHKGGAGNTQSKTNKRTRNAANPRNEMFL